MNVTFLPLKATKEVIEMKKGGLITYETDVVTDGPGIIFVDNPTGEYSVAIVNQIHHGGAVRVMVKGITQPAKKFEVGQIIGQLAVF